MHHLHLDYTRDFPRYEGAERIKAIRETMDKYMADGTLETLAPGWLLC